ncbi:MAG: type III-B CRISPR module RAMP protein Cmr4 [Saprospiraceae bacterium]|nr:type III-B CRISPR module RAMP protein Cmr4 [Saprospiraceae bacterium]MCF8250962.1 type III-B CRISPR module RAMP protein Cmr4 [Saprospiraceae bacterium]MCF8281939.1 type III-B CRISPR module RAMP protein Cmr4 [Bacteroidales bacterium]MCF8311926.1 type III-B CRISPR module RAMP protein Cmr4 [Saprospiraceae bacterium]MCF8441934.1 type III-B CRISPR module RAMP protein Cmr4 [Saprospiraceae bacterium]
MPSTTTTKHQATAFLLIAKTNLHPGAGSESYGVIDNLVQRDPATRLPTIHSTSLKGALREYFEDGLLAKNQKLVDFVFGADTKRGATDPSAGNYRFFAADLVSIPVRCDKKMFVNLTCPRIAKQILDMDAAIGSGISAAKKAALEKVRGFEFPANAKACHFDASINGSIILEENDTAATKATLANLGDAQAIFGADLVVAKDEVFRDLTSDLHLPVVARNQLNNGISENLWYEQLLPRETRFWFPVLYKDENGISHANFVSDLKANPVQVGANASVGYGFCSIDKFPA